MISFWVVLEVAIEAGVVIINGLSSFNPSVLMSLFGFVYLLFVIEITALILNQTPINTVTRANTK